MKQAIFAFAFLFAACSPPAEAPPANLAEPEAAAAAQAEAPSLDGAWTVTAINGAPPAQVWPMTVEIAGGSFALTSECRRMEWGISQDRNIVRFTPRPGRECARVKSPAELMVEKPIGLANIAMFSNEGSEVELSGPGGRIAMSRR